MSQTLLTGFGPFGPVVSNPSERLVRYFEAHPRTDQTLTTLVLPVSFARAPALMRATIQKGGLDGEPFAKIVMLGVAVTRTVWSVERFGRNIIQVTYPDADEIIPSASVIEPEGPEVLPSTWPSEKLVEALQSAGIAAEYSNSAGGYLCNYILFTTLQFLQDTGHSAQAGFFHMPADEETLEAGQVPPISVSFIQQLHVVQTLLTSFSSITHDL